MPEYVFWYDESTVYRACFEADDNAQARRLFQMLQDGEIGPDDIEGISLKEKNYEIGIDENSLSRLDGEDVN